MRKYMPTILAVLCSAVTAAGAYCALTFILCHAFTTNPMLSYPIAFPCSILGGLGCFLVFALLIWCYVRLCRRQVRRWLYLLDTTVYLGLLPVFFQFCSHMYRILSSVI